MRVCRILRVVYVYGARLLLQRTALVKEADGAAVVGSMWRGGINHRAKHSRPKGNGHCDDIGDSELGAKAASQLVE